MTVQWTRKALRQLRAVRARIAAEAPERAAVFCERLMDAAAMLEQHPFLGALLPEDSAHRQLVVQDYRIVYRIDEDNVRVMAIVSPRMLVTPKRLGR